MTDLQRKILDTVKQMSDDRGLPAEAYYMMGGFMGQMTEGEFTVQLDALCEEGHLEKLENWNGKMLYRPGKEPQPLAQGNFYAAVLEKFAQADRETILEMGEAAMIDLVQNSGMTKGERIFQMLIIAAKVGLGGVEALTSGQKLLADKIFARFFKGDMEEIYRILATDLDEKVYGFLKLMCDVGKHRVGMPLLHYILSFAYIDGGLKPEISAKLEEIFSMVLLMQFFSQDSDE